MTLPLHQRAVVADTHNDLLMAVSARPPHQWASFFRERWLPQLRDGGVDLQVLPVFIDDQYLPEGALRQTLRMIECAHVLAEGNPDHVRLCLDASDIDRALDEGKIALVLAMESMPGLDASVELIPTMHRLGVRVASIAHFGRTQLADGSGEDATGSGLTSAGIAALQEMERLGIVFDISHLGASGVAHVLELATRPVMATHSSARALRDHHRNLTDDQLRAVAATGGVICVNFFAPFLAEHEDDMTLDRLLDHIEHIVSVAGIDHVGLGPDFIREVMDDLTPPCCEDLYTRGVNPKQAIPGLEGPAGLPMVTEGLLARGLPEKDVMQIIGGNVHRFFGQLLS
ncbi:peptidase M19, renal dipeptidase [[Actinomadura] parvosata subsp. kistnae]|uniref:Membrane dipeptidase n=1 Tax=[Actinomadura] parvosata subsp. kistnae TaxID=1909395 RepID=A0A1U9ZQG1_9ACTN|nr:dipeptidase [Nonomuraea sp. ATCC 55076]AQZ60177.1 membrane dipeptidase [Nonomuraea sp. ATCC 55076]SPL91353.1 peptidase M19, renal dipeptidase [Actinomadura parvosata subsp. kistnae]